MQDCSLQDADTLTDTLIIHRQKSQVMKRTFMLIYYQFDCLYSGLFSNSLNDTTLAGEIFREKNPKECIYV